MPDWLLPLSAFIFMMSAPILAWWGSTRYFSGRFDEQQKNTQEWRLAIEARLKHIDITIESHGYAAMLVRVGQVEMEVGILRKWRHDTVEAYIPRAVDEHERRLNAIENRR